MLKHLAWLFLVPNLALAFGLNVCPKMPTATATANNWVSAISPAGATTLAQPGFTNLSGSIATGQIGDTTVTGKVLTGFSSGSGTVSATDTVLQGFNKLDGNVALKAPLASPTFSGTSTWPGSTTIDGSGNQAVGGTLGVTGTTSLNGDTLVKSSITGIGRVKNNAVSSTIAQDATTTFSIGANSTAILMINCFTTGNAALVFLTAGGTIALISDPDNVYSTTAGTSSKTNITYNAGTGVVSVQNKLTGSKVYYLMLLQVI